MNESRYSLLKSHGADESRRREGERVKATVHNGTRDYFDPEEESKCTQKDRMKVSFNDRYL